MRLKAIASYIIFYLIWIANRLVPKTKKSLVFHSYPDVEDQGISLLHWFSKNNDGNIKVCILTSGSAKIARHTLKLLVGDYVERLIIVKKTSPYGIWLFLRSYYVLFTHGLYGFNSVPVNQCVVNLWHGMPLKRIWSDMSQCPAPKSTFLLSTSNFFTPILAKAANINTDSIIEVGLPRNDLLFSKRPEVANFVKLCQKEVNKTVLFLPTFRKSNVGYVAEDGLDLGNVLGMTNSEVADFTDFLKSNQIRVLVKPHPMSRYHGTVDIISDNLWIVTDSWFHGLGVSLYEALGSVHALITDISSVYVDYLSICRPVFFYFPDISNYRKTRKFMFEPIEKSLAGPLSTTVDALISDMTIWLKESDRFEVKRRDLAKKLNPQNQVGSSDSLMRLVIES